MDLVAAVNYLHKLPEPVCHRDIKSMNVLLKSNPYLAKLSDFGLAQRFQERETKASTCSSKFFGTPGYVDPEFGQTGRYTDKADVFGVGIVMMELLNGTQACELNYHKEAAKGRTVPFHDCWREARRHPYPDSPSAEP